MQIALKVEETPCSVEAVRQAVTSPGYTDHGVGEGRRMAVSAVVCGRRAHGTSGGSDQRFKSTGFDIRSEASAGSETPFPHTDF